MTKGVPTYSQRGRGSGPCLLWGGLDKSRHIIPTALLVRLQCFRKDLYKAVGGSRTILIVISMFTGPTANLSGGVIKMQYTNKYGNVTDISKLHSDIH